jgi:hypothetical protein
MKRYFEHHSEMLPALCKRVDAAHPPKTPADLAAVLSHWIERIVSLAPELAIGLSTDFERHALERIPKLQQTHRLVVSPYSAALGGTMKMWRHRWISLFGQESVADASREGVLRAQGLLTYFSEVKLGFTRSDFNAEETWQTMNEATRNRLLDFMNDDAERQDLITAEESIRHRLRVQQHQEPTRDEIEAYVNAAERYVGRLEAVWDGATIALPIAFGAVSDDWQLAAELAVGLFCSKRLLGDRSKRLVETVVGRIQIVRALGRN